MVHVTPRAKVALRNALAEKVEEPGVGLRLHATGQGQLALAPDRQKAGDQIVEHDGDVVLLIGEEIAEPLAGTTIDCRETSDGAQLTISREPRSDEDEPSVH